MITILITFDNYPNVRQCNDYQIDCSNDQDSSLQLTTAEELLNSWNPHDDRSNKSENNLRAITRKICTFTASGQNGFTKLCRLGCEKHIFLSFGIRNTERQRSSKTLNLNGIKCFPREVAARNDSGFLPPCPQQQVDTCVPQRPASPK